MIGVNGGQAADRSYILSHSNGFSIMINTESFDPNTDDEGYRK